MGNGYVASLSADLIGRIYDAALDSSRWAGLLAEITDTLHASAGDLSIIDSNANAVRVHATHNYPDGQLDRMLRSQHLNPALHKAANAVLCAPMCSSRDLDIDAFHRTEYWQRAFGGTDYYDYLVVLVARSPQLASSWGVLGTRRRGAFSDDDLGFARAVSPHIARAVRIAELLDFHRVHAHTLDSAFDAMGVPALIVNEHQQVVHMNAQGMAELKAGRVLRCGARGSLECTSLDPAAAGYVQAVGRCAAGLQLNVPPCRLVTSDGPAFTAETVRLDPGSAPERRLALVLLRAHRDGNSQALETAAARFGLTQAETRILRAVIDGATLKEAAERLNVARSTVKSHLDAVYAKSGVRRRAELVRLVATGADEALK